MSEKYQHIICNKKNKVGSICFNRPEKHNAFHAEMIGEIYDAMRSFSESTKLRAVVIEANGKSFSAGADLSYMKEMASFSEKENQIDSLHLFDMFLAIYECPIPVVCKVKKYSFGGANGIIAASDYSLASEDAVFSFSETKLGILPATISPFVITKIGPAKSLELFTSARKFSATEALRIGLINEVVSSEDIDQKAESYLHQIISNGPQAVRKTKALVRQFSQIDPKDWRDETAKLIAEARVSAEGQEGILSFFEKRKANWSL